MLYSVCVCSLSLFVQFIVRVFVVVCCCCVVVTCIGNKKVASSQLVFNFVEIETSSVLIIGGQKPRSLDGFGLANGSHFKPNLGY